MAALQALIIGPTEKAKIKEAVAWAEEHPVPWTRLEGLALSDPSSVVSLDDRPAGFRASLSSFFVELPIGYLAAYSIEEQPAGNFRHLSVSVDRPGKLPSPEAVETIAKAFGFTSALDVPGRTWIEEFEPGQHAVNVVQFMER